MKKGGFLVVLSVWLLAAGWPMLAARGQQAAAQSAAPAAPARASAAEPAQAALVKLYCVTCHNQRTKAGELSLEGLDPTRVGDHPEIWEEVVRKLRARTMPPPGLPRPDEATYEALTARFEIELDKAAALRPNPGRPVIRRLNRAEYANAIRDLLALEVDVTSLLPADDSAFGFDNIADLLGDVAGAARALPDRGRPRQRAGRRRRRWPPGSDTYRVRQDRRRISTSRKACRSAPSAASPCTHVFPLDGEYDVSLELFRTNLEAIRGLEHPHQIEISVDGERVFLRRTVGGRRAQERRSAAAATHANGCRTRDRRRRAR